MHYYDVLQPERCTGKDFDYLLSLGWYPMGQTIFTTSHLFKEDDTPPNRVHWLRYPVDSISERNSHKRIRKKNKNFTIELIIPFRHTRELDLLYEKYFNSIDFDGYSSIKKATYHPDENNIYDSRAILVRERKKIISCGIFYEGKHSVASILHFFDPEYKKSSPGKYLILKTLDYCRKKQLKWYYPGYLIQGIPKMDYKLFLGKNEAQYYLPEPDPLHGQWLALSSRIIP